MNVRSGIDLRAMSRMVRHSFGNEERAAANLAAYLREVLVLQRARRCALRSPHPISVSVSVDC